MHVFVTGAAGFIGSHVVQRLLDDGHRVTGIDNFDPYYARSIKERNLTEVGAHDAFRFVEADLVEAPLDELLDGVEGVVHLAAQAGVRASWGDSFDGYLRSNVLATQRLLEASRERASLERFLYAGSSSIYGDQAVEATAEDFPPGPHSPYGLTKLASEQLGRVYRSVFGVPFCVARIFSCYGPRERPDKAIQKFMLAALRDEPITLYGDGSQRRDFSYVGDIVDGLVRCLGSLPNGETVNIARGENFSMNEMLEALQDVVGKALDIARGPREAGDVRVTSASIDKARRLVGYEPAVSIREGLARQWAHVQQHEAATS